VGLERGEPRYTVPDFQGPAMHDELRYSVRKDLMVDTTNGTIQYAVLSFGGWLGMGDKLFAVPWNAMRLDTANHCLVLDVPKERLKDAPGFDKDNWPDFADTTFTNRISSYYH
jgi:hypothetical protein